MIINAALHFSVHVKSKQEAFSPQLLEWCLQRPITVIRGIAQACDIDLGLYTTKTLAQTNPNHPVEVRTQLEQNSDENWAPDLSEEVGNGKIFVTEKNICKRRPLSFLKPLGAF